MFTCGKEQFFDKHLITINHYFNIMLTRNSSNGIQNGLFNIPPTLVGLLLYSLDNKGLAVNYDGYILHDIICKRNIRCIFHA